MHIIPHLGRYGWHGNGRYGNGWYGYDESDDGEWTESVVSVCNVPWEWSGGHRLIKRSGPGIGKRLTQGYDEPDDDGME